MKNLLKIIISSFIFFLGGCMDKDLSHIEEFNGVNVTVPTKGRVVTYAMKLRGELSGEQTRIVESAFDKIIDAVSFVTLDSRYDRYAKQFSDSNAMLIYSDDNGILSNSNLSSIRLIDNWVVSDRSIQFTLTTGHETNKGEHRDAFGESFTVLSDFYFERKDVSSEWTFIKNVVLDPMFTSPN